MKHKPQITAIIEDKRGRVLAVGRNSYVKTHRWQAELAAKVGTPDKIYIHAEVDAILKCRNLSSARTMKVFRYNAAGKPVLAKPCKVCYSAIQSTPIKKVVFTS